LKEGELIMRGAAYARYSTDMQDADSIEAQLRDIEKFALQNGITIVKKYVDEAYTGKTANRPEFLQMVEDSKRNHFDCIIVHKVDRFARDKYDSAIYKSQIKRNGIKIFYAAQPLTDNPEGHLMEGILESFAQYYSENLATEVMKGMKTKALRAEFNGGYAPLGYKIVEGKYVIDEYEAKAVKLIFELYSTGKTYDIIIEELNRQGYKTRFNAEFKRNSLNSILRNEKYMGLYTFNKASSRVYGKRNNNRKKDADQVIVAEANIPAIIDASTWELTRKRIEDSKSKSKYKAKTNYLLTGMITCGACGKTLYGQAGNNGFRDYHYYRCQVKGCRKSKISKEEIENYALDHLYNMYFTDTAIKELIKLLSDHMHEAFNNREKERKETEKAIKQIGTEMNNLLAVLAKGVQSDAIVERLTELEGAKRELQGQLLNLDMKDNDMLYTESEMKEVIKIQKQHIENRDIDECKKFIGVYIKSIVIRDEEIKIGYIHPL
jgi:site-specific DNA recombinase